MKKLLQPAVLILSVLFSLASPAFAQLTEPERAEWTAKLKKDYPLETCVVSQDPLGSKEMGPPVDYLHEEKGKDPRLVRFCCKGCIKSFKKNPAKYLKMLDEAREKKLATDAGQAAPAQPVVPGHENHSH
jgi:ribosomal protein L24E